MRRLAPVALAATLATVAFAASAQAPRLGIDVGCRPTATALTFLCAVTVADPQGRPVDGAEIVLSADMPSMPMAHTVSPVKARPVPGRPGVYEGAITLEMLGEWALKLRLDAPRRDVVVRKLDFQADRVSPVGAR